METHLLLVQRPKNKQDKGEDLFVMVEVGESFMLICNQFDRAIGLKSYQELSLLLFQQKQEQLSPAKQNLGLHLVFQTSIQVVQLAKSPEKQKKNSILT